MNGLTLGEQQAFWLFNLHPLTLRVRVGWANQERHHYYFGRTR
jgi:hypothetical protein